jgi:hypothetical protein
LVNASPTYEPPGTNALLTVDIGDLSANIAAGVSSRVEGHDAGDLLIAAPRYAGDLDPVRAGLPVVLRWVGPRGALSLATELVEVRRGQLTTWRVRPVGQVLISQRRDFARAPLSTPITLVPVVADLVLVTTGSLVDLSEGGLRARVSGRPLVSGTAVEAHLELDGEPVTFAAEVLRSGEFDRTSETHEVVLLIVAGRHGDLIRRVVFRQQSLARRRSGS